LPISSFGVLEGVDDGQRLLLARHVRGFLAGRELRAPDAEEVVVELERDAEVPAEGAVALDDRLVVRCQDRAGLDRGGDEGRGPAPEHVEVQLARDAARVSWQSS